MTHCYEAVARCASEFSQFLSSAQPKAVQFGITVANLKSEDFFPGGSSKNNLRLKGLNAKRRHTPPLPVPAFRLNRTNPLCNFQRTRKRTQTKQISPTLLCDANLWCRWKNTEKAPFNQRRAGGRRKAWFSPFGQTKLQMIQLLRCFPLSFELS